MKVNPNLTDFACVRCSATTAIDDHVEGCGTCASEGHAAALYPRYHPPMLKTLPDGGFGDWLAYSSGPDLGQGGTPLVPLDEVATELGVARLRGKSEFANPTGSHKDRMSAQIVARALDIGARKVVAASSGNAGASLAAFSAAAGLDCVIVTTRSMSPNWRRAIEMHGAALVFAESVVDRWKVVEQGVREQGWYPATNYVLPAVGSNPFGVDGYRTIAHEIFASDPLLPTDVLVPTSRGDLLWGIARGFQDLLDGGHISRTPRLHATEPFPRLERVLAGEDYRATFEGGSAMVSLGGSTVCYQALAALQSTGGIAVSLSEDDVAADQVRLARAGLYLELSSIAALSGLRRLLTSGQIDESARVDLIFTSHGYKEPV